MMMTKIISSRHLLRKLFSQSVQSLSYVWLFETPYSPWGFFDSRDWIYDAINHVILCLQFLLLWFRRTPKINSVSIFSPSICLQVMGPDAMILIFWCWALSQLFHSLFHFLQKALQFFFTFFHKGGVICISDVIDISPGNLDSSLCFIQPSVSHDIFCI